MSQVTTPIILSIAILAIAAPASSIISANKQAGLLTNDGSISSSSVVRISGNAASLTSLVEGVNAGKALKNEASVFGGKRKIFRLKHRS